MKTNHNKATPRVYHTLRQIVQRIPRWLIEKTANAHGVDARKFSATSHFVMLILGHLSRASCLTEICDDADLNKRKLSLVRNATPGKRNTFSHANRTRPAEVAEKVYWETVRHLGEVSPDFIPPKRVRWFLSRFRGRGIFAIDSTVIKLALSCIASYPYRSKKAAAKMHTRLPVGSFIPSVVRIEAGRPHDSAMADELTKDMKGGDVLLADRAYVDFAFLHNLTAREVFWVLRQKAIFGAFVQMRNGGWTLSPYSDVDFRYVLDLVFNVLVNEPEMMDVPMTGVWGSNYSGPELKRWTFRLFRHYLVEGRRTMLSDECGITFRPGHIRDCDFAAGAGNWRTAGDVRFDRIRGFGDKFEFRGGRQKLEVGDTFAVLRKTGGVAAEVSQKATGLAPGRRYRLEFKSFFVTDARSGASACRPTGVRARISDAENVKALPLPSNAKVNWHEVFFTAKGQKAEIVLTTADSPADEDVGVNCVGLLSVLED